MPSLGWKKKLVSASLVALGATGVTLGEPQPRTPTP